MAKESCRKAFSDEVLRRAKQDSRIFLLATDSRGSVTCADFFEELPKQAAEMGIAEQNAVSVAAGLAMTGRRAFVCGPACFLTARAFEQVKVDVAYNAANVKIIGVSAGVSYGPLGTTHTSLHDFAGMRSLPGIQILAPSDAVQTRWLTAQIASMDGPAYMRMGRGDVETVYEAGETFEIGKAKTLRIGSDVTLIACGEMVYHALCAAARLHEKGVEATVLDMFSLRPFDSDAVISAAKATGAIVTIEEHSVYGGLGEQTAHVLAENCPVKMRILGFPDKPYRIGTSRELFAVYGLDAEGIASAAYDLVKG
ncbi:MAG: transketolase family protein [Clostridiales bacterium]|nr:transketolase family protein [Clostridiales bacterium]MDO4350596.1 transketolase C-terminal domain-containing protein [Eubacteriales bacterium]MDY4007896.1 transketolase C-terminal domain-containing protein [Candidatus Limiplasma sp.]